MITKKEKTYSGIWPMTKENTYFGYKLTEEFYVWYKTKKTILKKVKGTKKEICRATLINGTMYINRRYLTTRNW